MMMCLKCQLGNGRSAVLRLGVVAFVENETHLGSNEDPSVNKTKRAL